MVNTKISNRTLVNELPSHIGEQVSLKGWVSQYRELKKFSFIILRDRTGYCNIFVPKDIMVNILPETVVEITGIVKKNHSLNIMASKYRLKKLISFLIQKLFHFLYPEKMTVHHLTHLTYSDL